MTSPGNEAQQQQLQQLQQLQQQQQQVVGWGLMDGVHLVRLSGRGRRGMDGSLN